MRCDDSAVADARCEMRLYATESLKYMSAVNHAAPMATRTVVVSSALTLAAVLVVDPAAALTARALHLACTSDKELAALRAGSLSHEGAPLWKILESA